MSKGQVQFKDVKLPSDKQRAETEVEASAVSTTGTRKLEFSTSITEENLAAPKNIFEAAERGSVGYIVKQVERSLEYDINQRDKYQRTALHWAAELNQVQVAEALLDYGIDVHATECNGRTAVHLASREGHAEMLECIMENMDDKQREVMANQRDMYGITPVYLSLQKGEESRRAFEILMKCGGKYNAQTGTTHKPADPAPRPSNPNLFLPGEQPERAAAPA